MTRKGMLVVAGLLAAALLAAVVLLDGRTSAAGGGAGEQLRPWVVEWRRDLPADGADDPAAGHFDTRVMARDAGEAAAEMDRLATISFPHVRPGEVVRVYAGRPTCDRPEPVHYDMVLRDDHDDPQNVTVGVWANDEDEAERWGRRLAPRRTVTVLAPGPRNYRVRGPVWDAKRRILTECHIVATFAADYPEEARAKGRAKYGERFGEEVWSEDGLQGNHGSYDMSKGMSQVYFADVADADGRVHVEEIEVLGPGTLRLQAAEAAAPPGTRRITDARDGRGLVAVCDAGGTWRVSAGGKSVREMSPEGWETYQAMERAKRVAAAQKAGSRYSQSAPAR